jgi:predicted dehydrogenase
VIHQGRNSLPAFNNFQKRFARMGSGDIAGYNHQAMAWLTGPGFFVLREAHPESDVPEELYFDYTAKPADWPKEWPRFKPNDSGVANLVYKNMKDYMRAVADGVTVGKAYKNGKSEDQYFILCRQ